MQMKLQVLGQRKGNGTRLLSSLNVILCQNVYFLVFLFLRDELLEGKKPFILKLLLLCACLVVCLQIECSYLISGNCISLLS